MKNYNYIFADLDGTLINTITGKTFPEGIWDMKINFTVLDRIKELNPQRLFIVSNQGGIEKGFVDKEMFSKKISYLIGCIYEYTGITTDACYCSSNDPNSANRKPNPGMVNGFIYEYNIPRGEALMIGDASGKTKQFSDSDLQCAKRANIDYIDVDDLINEEDIEYDIMHFHTKIKCTGCALEGKCPFVGSSTPSCPCVDNQILKITEKPI